jgi:hypothetical protein
MMDCEIESDSGILRSIGEIVSGSRSDESIGNESGVCGPGKSSGVGQVVESGEDNTGSIGQGLEQEGLARERAICCFISSC